AEARAKAVRASVYMRRHGPFMPAILGPEEMEYTTRPAVLEKLKKRMEDIG
ncbi:MAG: fructose-1,6-bisphosphatase, partial [Methanomassiliicoccales archaeon]|nr:fructose-1,6-bisphosphatase [Methanomassiliicoccales archaeon]